MNLKTQVFFAIASFVLFSCASQNTKIKSTKDLEFSLDKNFQQFSQTITQEDLKKHLTIFASDSFGGRGTGQVGQSYAIDYLKNSYAQMAILPTQNQPDYKQEFSLLESSLPIYTVFYKDKKVAEAKDLYTYYIFPTVRLDIKKVMFLNFGIDAKEYSDYQNIDAKDQVVLIKFGEPIDPTGSYTIGNSKSRSKYSSTLESIQLKIADAKRNGAKAVIVTTGFSESNPILWNEKSYTNHFDVFEEIRYKIGRYSYVRLADVMDLDIPVFFISNDFLQKLGLNPSLPYKNGQSLVFDVEIDYSFEGKFHQSANVLAYIEGSENPEETVVISAHLDHLGTEKGKIYNGADDDGSGTVSILEIAEAFQIAKEKGFPPKKSILFLHFGGEELGLLGSFYYAKHPAFPMDKTLANLNIDMVGRVDRVHKDNENYIYLIGSNRISKDLHQISEKTNNFLGGLAFDYTFNKENDPNRFYYRSDHYNFAKNGVPVIFYFSGVHEDYHQPTDTVEKIRFDLLEKRARLIFATAWQLANLETELK